MSSLLTSSNLSVDIRITNTKISDVERVKLIGENLEGRLNFDCHVNTLLKKANKKYHALARVCSYMNTKKTCSNECFFNISVLLLSSCLDVGL